MNGSESFTIHYDFRVDLDWVKDRTNYLNANSDLREVWLDDHNLSLEGLLFMYKYLKGETIDEISCKSSDLAFLEEKLRCPEMSNFLSRSPLEMLLNTELEIQSAVVSILRQSLMQRFAGPSILDDYCALDATWSESVYEPSDLDAFCPEFYVPDTDLNSLKEEIAHESVVLGATDFSRILLSPSEEFDESVLKTLCPSDADQPSLRATLNILKSNVRE